MLGSGFGREKERGTDFSDVVRRVGGPHSGTASTRGGFEIYVDPAEDSDITEIVVLKKKKSRVALDGMKWGALGEVTNVPAVTAAKELQPSALLKVKAEEKWWSIGRGRKDSKEKEKEKTKVNGEKTKTRAKCKFLAYLWIHFVKIIFTYAFSTAPAPEQTIREPYSRSKSTYLFCIQFFFIQTRFRS